MGPISWSAMIEDFKSSVDMTEFTTCHFNALADPVGRVLESSTQLCRDYGVSITTGVGTMLFQAMYAVMSNRHKHHRQAP
jgi:hypothetical protein